MLVSFSTLKDLLQLSPAEARELDYVYYDLRKNLMFVDIASALAQNGAIVYIVGRRKEKLDQAVKMHKTVHYLKGVLIKEYEGQIDRLCRRCNKQRRPSRNCISNRNGTRLHQSSQ